MIRCLFALLFCLFISCDDGDLQIEIIDFDDATIDFADLAEEVMGQDDIDHELP